MKTLTFEYNGTTFSEEFQDGQEKIDLLEKENAAHLEKIKNGQLNEKRRNKRLDMVAYNLFFWNELEKEIT